MEFKDVAKVTIRRPECFKKLCGGIALLGMPSQIEAWA